MRSEAEAQARRFFPLPWAAGIRTGVQSGRDDDNYSDHVRSVGRGVCRARADLGTPFTLWTATSRSTSSSASSFLIRRQTLAMFAGLDMEDQSGSESEDEQEEEVTTESNQDSEKAAASAAALAASRPSMAASTQMIWRLRSKRCVQLPPTSHSSDPSLSRVCARPSARLHASWWVREAAAVVAAGAAAGAAATRRARRARASRACLPRSG